MSQAREIGVKYRVDDLPVLEAELHALASTLSARTERASETHDSLIRAALAGV